MNIEEFIPAPGRPLGREAIEQVLPHRAPFLWLTRVVENEPGQRIVAELDVDPALPLFEGHFPEYPVLPGVIIMEALAQAAAFCILCQPANEGKLGFFAGINNAKFRQQVRPGDTLRLEATITKANARMARAEVCAYVGEAVAASAEQMYVMAPAAAKEA